MGLLRIYLCGIAMGMAELIPGISGGTVAFITGIYQRLVSAIGNFNISWLWSVMQLPFCKNKTATVLKAVDATFLLVLVLGMLSAWLVTAQFIQWLLAEHRILLWACLFGLMLGTIIMMIGRTSQNLSGSMPLFAGGFVLGFVLSGMQLPSLTTSPLVIIVMGGIATCAWILPGLSGSFLLLITGFYQPFINAIANGNINFLALFAVGAVICLPLFSAWLGRLLATRNAQTMMFLTAFMLGSLKALWPWQRTISYFFNAQNENLPQITEPVLPQTYAAITGEDPQLFSASILAISMVVLVILLERSRSSSAL